jgi:pyruvate kinase
MAGCRAADDLAARYVVVFTESGDTARLVSHFRPSRPILGVTPSEHTYRRLALPWGVKPIVTRQYDSVDEMLDTGLSTLKATGKVDSGDTVVVIFGTSPLTGGTNMMKIHRF